MIVVAEAASDAVEVEVVEVIPEVDSEEVEGMMKVDSVVVAVEVDLEIEVSETEEVVEVSEEIEEAAAADTEEIAEVFREAEEVVIEEDTITTAVDEVVVAQLLGKETSLSSIMEFTINVFVLLQ